MSRHVKELQRRARVSGDEVILVNLIFAAQAMIGALRNSAAIETNLTDEVITLAAHWYDVRAVAAGGGNVDLLPAGFAQRVLSR